MQGDFGARQGVARTVIQHDALDRPERSQLDLAQLDRDRRERPVQCRRVETGNQRRRPDRSRRRPHNPRRSFLPRRTDIGPGRLFSRQQGARPRPVQRHCHRGGCGECRPLDSVRQQDHHAPVGCREPPRSAALHVDWPLSARRTKHVERAARNDDPALFVRDAGRPAVGVNQHRGAERFARQTLILAPTLAFTLSDQLELEERPLAGLPAAPRSARRPCTRSRTAGSQGRRP